MYKKYVSILCILISIILMATPYGIAMTFAPNPSERITKYFSYFSLMPFGYGNWFPLIIVILSLIAFFQLLISIKKQNKIESAQGFIYICIICSLISWIVFNTFTIIGACVAILHFISLKLLKK